MPTDTETTITTKMNMTKTIMTTKTTKPKC